MSKPISSKQAGTKRSFRKRRNKQGSLVRTQRLVGLAFKVWLSKQGLVGHW